jgi:uncharacterized protein DUF4157
LTFAHATKGTQQSTKSPPSHKSAEKSSIGSESEVPHYQSPISSIKDILASLYPRSNTPKVQPKLRTTQPGDKYEQEADRVAEEITKPATDKASLVSPLPLPSSSPKSSANIKNEGLQIARKRSLQPQTRDAGGANRILDSVDVDRKSGSTLDAPVKQEMESKLGFSLEGVRLHTGKSAGAAAKSVGARAFTVGRDIFFGDQEYRPDTRDGKKLLAHELTHVMQQTIGSPSNSQAFGSPKTPLVEPFNISKDPEGRIARAPSGGSSAADLGHSEDSEDQKRYNLIMLNPANNEESRVEGLTRDQATKLLKPLLDVAFEAYNANLDFVKEDRIEDKEYYNILRSCNQDLKRHSNAGDRALRSGEIDAAGNAIYSAMSDIVLFDRDVRFYNMKVKDQERLPLLDRSPEGYNQFQIDLGGNLEIDLLIYAEEEAHTYYFKLPSSEKAVSLLKEHDMKYVFEMIKLCQKNIGDVKKRFGETRATKEFDQIYFEARNAWQYGHDIIFGKRGEVDPKEAAEHFNLAVSRIRMFDKGVISYREQKEEDAEFWHTVREVATFLAVAVTGIVSGGSALTLFAVMAGTETVLQAAEIHAGVRPKFEAGKIVIAGATGAIHIPVIRFRNDLFEALLAMGASRNFATKLTGYVVTNYVAAKANADIGGLINIGAAKLMNEKVDVMNEVDKLLLDMDLKHLTIEAIVFAAHAPHGAHPANVRRGKGADTKSGEINAKEKGIKLKREPSVVVDQEFRNEATKEGTPVSEERAIPDPDTKAHRAQAGEPTVVVNSEYKRKLAKVGQEVTQDHPHTGSPAKRGKNHKGANSEADEKEARERLKDVDNVEAGFAKGKAVTYGITDRPVYAVRVGAKGRKGNWYERFFYNKAEAVEFAKQVAARSPRKLEEELALPNEWAEDKRNKSSPGVDPKVEGSLRAKGRPKKKTGTSEGNPLEEVSIWEISPGAAYKEGTVGPQPEGGKVIYSGNPESPGKTLPGGGQQVLIDPKAKAKPLLLIDKETGKPISFPRELRP